REFFRPDDLPPRLRSHSVRGRPHSAAQKAARLLSRFRLQEEAPCPQGRLYGPGPSFLPAVGPNPGYRCVAPAPACRLQPPALPRIVYAPDIASWILPSLL